MSLKGQTYVLPNVEVTHHILFDFKRIIFRSYIELWNYYYRLKNYN